MIKTNEEKIILDLCGGTGSWSKPYKDAGYKVINITLPEYDVTNVEFKEKGMLFFNYNSQLVFHIKYSEVYGILAAPPCTEFSYAKTNSKYPRDIKKGMEIVQTCLNIIWHCQYNLPTPLAKTTTLKFWALENPYGLLRRFIGNPCYELNPYDFGDAYKKRTQLWGLFNFPVKNPVKEYSKNYIHTISPPGKPLKKFDKLLTKEIHPEFYGKLTRKARRAITPQGFANAFYEANK